MDGIRKLIEAFVKIAPHLKSEQVLIGLVFILFVSHSALRADQILVFVLALIVILGLFGLLFLKLRQQQLSASDRRNYEIEIDIARRLLDLVEDVESKPSQVRYRLMKMAKRILDRTDRVDLASDAQGQIDEATRPPPDPDLRH